LGIAKKLLEGKEEGTPKVTRACLHGKKCNLYLTFRKMMANVHSAMDAINTSPRTSAKRIAAAPYNDTLL
jgi:hypothetical protein